MSSPAIPSMRIIYFTSQGAAVTGAVLGLMEQLGQRVSLVVTTPGPAARRTTAYKEIVANLRSDQDVLVTSHIRRLPALLKGLEPDLIFVTGFPWRLPVELLALPRLGSVNTHPALLPRYRGPNPVFWQFMNGETQSGLTMHRMEADFDTGPILSQRAIDITPEDDVDSLFPKFSMVAGEMLVEALTKVAAGDPGTPQPSEGASYAPLATEAEAWLDWSRTAAQLRNQIRAWGEEGAKATVEGQTLLARRARVVSLSPALERAAPGKLLEESAEGLLVRAGQDGLLIEDYERTR
ncbi:MAG TPA: methionyl-tRNA formyltransferase [Ktedonobacterales bacterium]|nr:methionyl-tRNA formyltransferase [Ktedonobacterales bacterium]